MECGSPVSLFGTDYTNDFCTSQSIRASGEFNLFTHP